jgi:hypothetical protein
MRKITPCFRLGLIISAAWLLAASAIVIDGSDRDDRPFRLKQSCCHTEQMQYQGCSPRKLDLGETIDYYYLDAKASINGLIADCRNEPNLDFDWLERQKEKGRASARSERREAKGMEHARKQGTGTRPGFGFPRVDGQEQGHRSP